MKSSFKLHPDGFVRRGLNPCSQRVEESCDLAGKHRGDSNVAVKLERSGGDVGLVAELFRHAKYPRLGAGTYSAASMQGAIHGSDRRAQSFRDVANASRFPAFVSRSHVWCRSQFRIPDRPKTLNGSFCQPQGAMCNVENPRERTRIFTGLAARSCL